MRRAFTLIELLVVIAIMGTMVTVGVVGVRAGKAHSQLAGATRDVLAIMRQARAIALITQKPTVITYANETIDDENNAKVTVTSEKLFDDAVNDNREIRTVAGDLVGSDGTLVKWDSHTSTKSRTVKSVKSVDGEAAIGSGGESLNDIFSQPISLEITKGLRIKVEKGDDNYLPASADGKVYKSAISVFSTTEYITSKFAEKKEEKKVEGQDGGGGKSESSLDDADVMTEPLSIAWQTNGRTEPHTVWIYPEGSKPDKGLTITVDKFGECKVSQWQEDED